MLRRPKKKPNVTVARIAMIRLSGAVAKHASLMASVCIPRSSSTSVSEFGVFNVSSAQLWCYFFVRVD